MTTKKNILIKCRKIDIEKEVLPEGKSNFKDKAPKPIIKTSNRE
jgi:hypothetical protein